MPKTNKTNKQIVNVDVGDQTNKKLINNKKIK